MPRSVAGDAPVVAITYRESGRASDGILDYAGRLAGAVQDTGRLRSLLVTRAAEGGWSLGDGATVADLPALAGHASGVLLQYNPFSYGRWGFAPWLPRDLRRLRRDGLNVAVMVHEAFMAPTRAREWILRGWQRAQCRAILAQADVVFTSTEALRETLRALVRREDIRHLPVGSNLPDRRGRRTEMRARLGLGDGDLALVAFGTGHPSQRGSLVARAAQATGGRPTVLLNLGAGAPVPAGLPSDVRVLSPGRLPSGELATWLGAGDLFVAPFSDGVSTRRTTFMAALQHELPVVGTLGQNTDRVLAEATAAARLVAAEAPVALERAVGALADDPQARREVGLAGRRLYEARFSWPVIAGEVADALAGRLAPGRPAPRR